MGTTESHLCNWIELHNAGPAPIDMSGWTLTINETVRKFDDGEGATLTIQPGAYYLLKRTTATCPDPVPGVAGLLMTMGNLPNSGATLILRNKDGAIVDQLAGGEDWVNIGGDNSTKETAQYTVAGWRTGEPTPGAPNIDPDTVRVSDSATEQTAPRVTQILGAEVSDDARTARELLREKQATAELRLQISAPEVVYVGQEVFFSAEPSGLTSTLHNSLRYHWNFGDTYTLGSNPVTHIYSYPGNYVVSVTAEYADRSATADMVITVLPVRVSLTKTEDGVMQLHNNAPYEISLDGFELLGSDRLRIPDRTVLLPNATLTIPPERFLAGSGAVELRDGSGRGIVIWNQSDELEDEEKKVAVSQLQNEPYVINDISSYRLPEISESEIMNPTFTFTSDKNSEKQLGTEELNVIDNNRYVEEEEKNSLPVNNDWPLWALLLLVTSVLFITYYTKKQK